MSRVEQSSLSASSSHQPPCSSTRLPSLPPDEPCNTEPCSTTVLVSVVMPCLNEARTVAACIDQAHAGCRAALAKRNSSELIMIPSSLAPYSGRGAEGEGQSAQGQFESDAHSVFTYEIIIADNGSTDGSQAIAEAHGARVVHVAQKGYGAALLGGFAAARGKYIVMGDSDCSYDFGEVPRFLDKLEEGYDLVMGNRFAGGIMPGAMPWHHRYIGNPLLSGLGRLLYRTPCRDWHCGLRAFEREKLDFLQLKCTGMELASEIPLRASQTGLRTSEIPVKLYPDGRDRPPHLRSVRDGLRHVSVLLAKTSRQTHESIALVSCSPIVLLVSLWLFGAFGPNKPEVIFPDPVELDEQSFSEGLATFDCVIKSPIRLSILGVTTSCGCLRTDEPPLVVEKGETKKIAFIVDRRKSRAKANMPVDFRVTFLTNGETGTIEKQVTVLPAMDF